MDVEIEEMNASLTVMDLKAIKAEVIAEVMARLSDDKRLEKRRENDRKLADGASRRPDDL
ncbi:hypothetical protein [Flavisphingomonas formosensis]|uniref:hypothetical protein n=1 Tax=Flavisphingomonas formosensis TaxID=861534 RepID=UPI0012F88612|nr:hypothetical protein [Sphingomonas formosensis]